MVYQTTAPDSYAARAHELPTPGSCPMDGASAFIGSLMYHLEDADVREENANLRAAVRRLGEEVRDETDRRNQTDLAHSESQNLVLTQFVQKCCEELVCATCVRSHNDRSLSSARLAPHSLRFRTTSAPPLEEV